MRNLIRTATGFLFAILAFAATPLPAAQFRITTWNLEWFPNGHAKEAPPAEQEKRVRAAADVLRTLNPDIILLQEVRDYDTAFRLGEAIKPGAYQVAICSAFKEPFQAGLGRQQVVILAKEPAQAAWAEPWKSMQGVDPPRGFAFAWFKIKGADIGVYCVHLKSNLIMRGDKAAEEKKNIRKREVAAQQILAHAQSVVARAMPMVQSIIVGGDFNTNTDEFAAETTFAKFEESGFSNCMDEIPRLLRVTHPGGHGYPDTTFDYLLARGATLGRPQITRSRASDHLPVTCDVTVGASSLTKDAATATGSTVTITRSTTITIPYGKSTLTPGMRLPVASREGATVLVRYMGGVYAVPLSATDLR